MSSAPIGPSGDPRSKKSFLSKLGTELAPLVRHAAVVVFLDCTLLLVGYLLHVAEGFDPKHEKLLSRIQEADLLFVYIVTILFGLYSIVSVLTILISAALLQYHESV